MWPFKSKEQIAAEEAEWRNVVDASEARRKAEEEAEIKPFRDWKPIGGTFNYLGRECRVTGHSIFVNAGMMSYWEGGITADYADNDGVIRSLEFRKAEALTLIAEQP